MSDESPVPGDTGQTDASGGQPPSSEGQGTSQGTFAYSFDRGDGRVHNFNSKEELDQFFRTGIQFQDDYTRKTQGLAEQRKAFESEREKYQSDQKQFQELASKIRTWRDFLQTPRGKAWESQITQALSSGTSPEEIRETIGQQYDPRLNDYEERLKAIEERNAQLEADRQREIALNTLSAQYPDLDRETILKEVDRLAAIPGDNTVALLELIHLATRGKALPTQVEKRVEETLEQRRTPTPMPAVSGNNGGTPQDYANLDEAHAAAMKKYGGR